MPRKTLTIGELARGGGVGIETIRYYQRRGLLPEPPRKARGFREYSEEVLRTLRFIRRAKGLGFTLKETEMVLALRAARGRTHNQLLELLGAKAVDLERKVTDLQVAIQALRRLREQMANLPPDERWTLLDPDGAATEA